jgi:hypothetical protein
LHPHVAQPAWSSHTRLVPRVCVVVLACTTLLGCGDVDGQPKDDAGMVVPVTCTDQQPVCDRDGVTVRACVGGQPGDMLELCAGNTVCTAGRCMSQACAAAWMDRHTFTGCFFYTAQAPNVASDAEQPMSFLITNPGGAEATVVLERIDESAKWVLAASTSVAPGKSARLSIAREEVTNFGVSSGAGLRLVSNLPVTVAQIESDDSKEDALSTSGTMLLPAHVLGLRHRVLAYPQRATPDIDALVGGGAGGAARLLIVGTRPDTPVHLTAGPNGNVIIAPDSLTLVSGATMDIVLGDGDVFQVSSAADSDDLSGFEIWADVPVAVFSGNVSTAYGVVDASGINSPDMAHEQIPPIVSWSYEYVAARLPPQANTCDTLLGVPNASVWRMVAGGPGPATVEFYAPPGVEGLPSGKSTLDEGKVLELVVSGGDFSVKASGPLLLAQGIDCEPTLALAVSADKWLTDLSFAVLPNFDQLIAVARPKGATVTLDGVPIDDTRFVPAGTDGDGKSYEVARIQLITCNPREVACTHRLTGEFGMTLRGMDVLSSYALTAPSWRGCIDKALSSCVD